MNAAIVKHVAGLCGLLLASMGCSRQSRIQVPPIDGTATAFSSAEPTVSASGLGSCFRLETKSPDRSGVVVVNGGATRSTVEAPGILTLTAVDGPACAQALTGFGSDDVLWVLMWLGDGNEQAALTGGISSEVDLVVRSFSRADLSATGAGLILASKRLRSEGKRFLFISMAQGKQTDTQAAVLQRAASTVPLNVTLNVVDTRIENAFGVKATAVLLWKPHQRDGTEKYAGGFTGAGLWYPARHFYGATSPFVRKMALEANVGPVVGLNDAGRKFYSAGMGLSYYGILGAGFAWDASKSDFFGAYLNLTVVSDDGIFGGLLSKLKE